MSDHERFTQVAHQKWATMSKLIGWLIKNERMSDSLRSLMINEQKSDSLKKNLAKIVFSSTFFVYIKKTSDSLIPSFLMSDVSKSLRTLTKNERCERIARSGCSLKMSDHERFAQVAHQKWMNEWIACFFSKWVNHSFFEQIAHSLIFLQKTIKSPRKPMSEFPALVEMDAVVKIQ